MSTATVTNTGTVIWAHIIEAQRANLTPEVACYILSLDFRKEDQRRMAKLSA